MQPPVPVLAYVGALSALTLGPIVARSIHMFNAKQDEPPLPQRPGFRPIAVVCQQPTLCVPTLWAKHG